MVEQKQDDESTAFSGQFFSQVADEIARDGFDRNTSHYRFRPQNHFSMHQSIDEDLLLQIDDLSDQQSQTIVIEGKATLENLLPREEVKQSYELLDGETLAEIEEINPGDFYSYDPKFNQAVDVFFNEADLDNTLNCVHGDIDPKHARDLIKTVLEKCDTGLAALNFIQRENKQQLIKVTRNLQSSLYQSARDRVASIASNTSMSTQANRLKFQSYFEEYANSLLNFCIGEQRRQELTPEERSRVYSSILDRFTEQTMLEVNLLKNELFLIKNHLIDHSSFSKTSKASSGDPNNNAPVIQFFSPPLDSFGSPVLTACIEVMKKAIFKLAVIFERVNLFTEGRVYARTVTLDCVKPELWDSVETVVDKNPFKNELDGIQQKSSLQFSPARDDDFELRHMPATGLQLTDKKDLLRIYQLSKLIYDEIVRLNQKNVDKKVLAKQLILTMQKIGIRHPYTSTYQLGVIKRGQPWPLDLMHSLRNGQLSERRRAKQLRDLWVEFTTSTSFKSKANELENQKVRRDLFIYLELDIFKNTLRHNDLNFCIQLMSDLHRPLSKLKKISVSNQSACQDANQLQKQARLLFLKVPFEKVAANFATVVIKVFQGNPDCEKHFSCLVAHGIIPVSEIFWKHPLQCGVSSRKTYIDFYEPDKRLPIEQVFRDFYEFQNSGNVHVKLEPSKIGFNVQYKLNLMSNLNESALDLSCVSCVAPQVNLNEHFHSQTMFNESTLISSFTPALPNRPYNFKQGVILRNRIRSIAQNCHELCIVVQGLKLADAENVRAMRFRASIHGPMGECRSGDNSGAEKCYIYRQLDEKHSSRCFEYVSAVYPVFDNRCPIQDHFFVSLPHDPEILKSLFVYIDIQEISFIPSEARRFIKLFKRKLVVSELIEDSSKYQTVNKFRKIVHMGTYNEASSSSLMVFNLGNGKFEPLHDNSTSLDLQILPYSSFDLHNQALTQVNKAFTQWAENIFSESSMQLIKEGVSQITNIRTTADQLLKILLQILVTMEEFNRSFQHIFEAFLIVLEKLQALPDNEGSLILDNFLKDMQHDLLLSNVYENLLIALLVQGEQVIACVKSRSLPASIEHATFYHSHLKSFRLLPRILQVVAAGQTRALDQSNDSAEQDDGDQRHSTTIFVKKVKDCLKLKQHSDNSAKKIWSSFIQKMTELFQKFGSVMRANDSPACQILQQILFANLPELFEFVATYMPHELLIKEFVGQMLFQPVASSSPATELRLGEIRTNSLNQSQQARQQDWLWQIIVSQSSDERAAYEIKKNSNLFILKTIAIAQILQSQTMITLPNNSVLGETIAKGFCQFLSQNIDDYRLRGDRSVPMQDSSAGDNEKISTLTFYHTVLFFLTSYMKFQNNFVNLGDTGLIRTRTFNDRGQSQIFLQQNLTQFASSIRFEEEDLHDMHSLSYLVQDCDLFIAMLLRSIKESPQNLPDILQANQKGLADQNKVTMFQLLQQLSRKNMQRLLVRNHAERNMMTSTRKNLRDLLSNILSVLYAQGLEFCRPFTVYEEQFQFTVIANFATQLSFVLLKRQKEHPDQVKEFKSIFSKLWLVMLNNFIDMRERNVRHMRSRQEHSSYFEESGKQLHTMLFFMKNAKNIQSQILSISQKDNLTLLNHLLPRLIKIVHNEAKNDTFNTLEDLLQFLLILDEIIMRKKDERSQKRCRQGLTNDQNQQFSLLSVIDLIGDELIQMSQKHREHLTLFYKYDRSDEHSLLQTDVLWSLQQIVQTESELRKYVSVECHLCESLSQQPKLTKLQLATLDIAKREQTAFCSRCSHFVSFMDQFKQLEMRKYLFEASKAGRPSQLEFDALYHAYAHYRLVHTKLRFEVFSLKQTPKAIFEAFSASIEKLKARMKLRDLDEWERRNFNKGEHLNTELAFCKVRLLEMDSMLLQQGRSYQNEQGRKEMKKQLVKDLYEVSRAMMHAGFFQDAIKLNHISYQLELGSLNHDAQTNKYIESVICAGFNLIQSYEADGARPMSAVPLKNILENEILIAQSINQFEERKQAKCSYLLIKFFGKKFAPELRNSPHGFIMRYKTSFQLATLMKELRQVYQIEATCFDSLKSMPRKLKHSAEQENPMIIFVQVEPLTPLIQENFGRGDGTQNGRELLEKQIQPRDDVISAQMSRELSKYNYTRHFYAKYLEHSEEFKRDCYDKIKQKIELLEKDGDADWTQEECDRFVDILYQMQGQKTAPVEQKQKFWQKCANSTSEPAIVKTAQVEQVAQSYWDKIGLFQNEIITLYSVEDTFPTTFFMQEIQNNVIDVRINHIQSAQKKLKQFIASLKASLQKLKDKTQSQGSCTEQLVELYDLLYPWVEPGKEGLSEYMKLLFAKGGFHDFETEVKHLHQLLELFRVMQNFLVMLERGLDELKKHGSERLVPAVFQNESTKRQSFNAFYSKLHSYKIEHQEIRDRCEIDIHMAQQRDKMADDSDEDESD